MDMSRARLMLSAMHHRNCFQNPTTNYFIKDVCEQRLTYHVRHHHVDILLYLLRERTEFRMAWKMAMAIDDDCGVSMEWITDELLDTLMTTLGSFYDLNKAGANDETFMPPSWWTRGCRDDSALVAWRCQCRANVANVLDVVAVQLYDRRIRRGNQPMLRMHPIGLRLWLDATNVEGSLMSVMIGYGGFSNCITVSEFSAVGNYIKHRDAASLRVLFESPVLSSQSWFNDMGLDAFDVCCERGWYEGAQLCFDVFTVHRQAFVHRVVLHVLRFPDDRYAALSGFLHHRRDAFAACFDGDRQHKRIAIEHAAVFCLHAGDVDGLLQCRKEMVIVCDKINMASTCAMEGILTVWIRECIQHAANTKKTSDDHVVKFTANQLACLEAFLFDQDGLMGGLAGTLICELYKVRLVDNDPIHLVGFMRAILKHQKDVLLRCMYLSRKSLCDNVDDALFSPKHILEFARLVAAAPHSMRAFFVERFRAVKVAHGDAGKNFVRFAISDIIFNLATHLPYEQTAFVLSLLEVEHTREAVTAFLRASVIDLFGVVDDVLLLLRNTYGADTMRYMATNLYMMSIHQMRMLFGDDDAAVMWRTMHAGAFGGMNMMNWWLKHDAADLALLRTCVGDRLCEMMRALSNDEIKTVFCGAFHETPHNCDALDFMLSLLTDGQRACLREDGVHVDGLSVDASDVAEDQTLRMAVWLKRHFAIDDDTVADLLRGPQCGLGELAFSVDGVAHFEELLDVADTSSMPVAVFHEENDPDFCHELARAMLARGTPRQKYTALFLLIHKGLPTSSRALFRQLATDPDVYPLLCERRIHLNNADDDTTTLLEYVSDRYNVPTPFSPTRHGITTMSVLLSLPCLRQQSAILAANPRRRTTLARQIAELDTSHESSMRQFSPKERAVLDHMREVYGDAVTVRGVPAILAELQRALREAYEAEPAEYRGRPLPFSHDLLLRTCREWAAEEAEAQEGADPPATRVDLLLAHAMAAYHGNVWHTAARWFMKPNPWMHPRANWVEVDADDPSRRWAAGMESDKICYLAAMYWLAATDTATPMLNGASVRDNVAFFARTLALINRGHNYDSATRTRKLPGGQTVRDDIDDGEGDRPSCSMGLEQRFFTSVPANPHAHYNDVEERLTGAFVARLLAKVRALPEHERAALINAAETYVIDQTLDAERAFLLMTYNLSEEEQAAVAAEAGASAAYAAPFFATNDDCLHSHVMQYIPTFYYNAAL